MNTNNPVNCSVERLIIPTYPEPAQEEMPMFAENRVHQRTSGRPYPNKVVLRVNREEKVNKTYTCIRLENEYLRILILPELGGRIFSALDKTTGYDFFYKQHVIKPALIGVLGSWISGGVEFNWPFHHRPSTFMPVDYAIENEEDGSVTVWLSEHDPMERMKGMVGIRLCPGEAIFETRVRLCNRTPVTRSFLWWENAAVPVNREYQIFYPQDVSYVRFHYKRSVTTYPVASNATGVYNGIRFNGDVDVSMHNNTIQPTSYFSAASKYDFFGGYDHGKRCGVVHIGDHHISTGKKLFTWAYNQLSQSWEKALTDTDGAYAELMAGSYSDNQPDFAWLSPYETKSFSQYWYPIGKIGAPVFANGNGALSWDGQRLGVQTTKFHADAHIKILLENDTLFEETADLTPGEPFFAEICAPSKGCTLLVTDQSGATVLSYTEKARDRFSVPEPTTDMPAYETVKTAQELVLEGVHVKQYRDPAVLPDIYWKEALKRDPEYIPALLELGEFCYERLHYEEALGYIEKAIRVLTRYNSHPQSGKACYLRGLIELKMHRIDEAYDSFYAASWNGDSYSAAMTQIAAVDGIRKDYTAMRKHSKAVLSQNAGNLIAQVWEAAAEIKLGNTQQGMALLKSALEQDPLNHLARFFYSRLEPVDFFAALKSDPSQTCLDLAFDLIGAGFDEEATALLEQLSLSFPQISPLVFYTLGSLYADSGLAAAAHEQAKARPLSQTFPFRPEEYEVLQKAIAVHPDDATAWYYLGCLLYDKGHYPEAADCYEQSIRLDGTFYIPYRNLAVANYSHLHKKEQVVPLLFRALALKPHDEQLIYETVYVMEKLGHTPQERITFLEQNCAGSLRDDICLAWAKALSQSGQPEKALDLLAAHSFVPCEGGEHAVAEQYMFAHHLIGRRLLKDGNPETALVHFRLAQALPDNLGAGLWHEVKLVPHQYYEAVCCELKGNKKDAEALFRHILNLTVDYFSDMHLKELPYYQALCLQKLNQPLKGDALINEYLRKWTTSQTVKDPGFFGTTPFFISYIDDPAEQRTACYQYLEGLARRYTGDQIAAKRCFESSLRLEPGNLYCQVELDS